MRIAQSLIADQLKVLKTIMPPKASGLLEAILVKDSYLIADNFDYTIGTLVPVQMDEPFVLPKKAIEMIENLSGDIEIDADGTVIRLTCGGVKSQFSTVPVEKFLVSNPFDHGEIAFEIDADLLCDKFSSVLYACAANDKGKTTGGVRLLGDLANLEFSALDGFRLALDSMPFGEELDIVIPYGVVRQILSLKPTGKIFIFCEENRVIFETDTYIVSSKLITGQRLDYTAVFPKGDEKQFVVNRVDLLGALSRCLICAMGDQRKEPVQLDVENGKLYISTKTPTSTYEETIPTRGHNEMKIAIDGRYLTDALKSFGEEELTIRYFHSLKPLVITGKSGTALLLPVKVKA